MPPLSQQFDQFMEKNDPYWSGKENYRLQEYYKNVISKEPRIPLHLMTVRSDDPNIVAVDI